MNEVTRTLLRTILRWTKKPHVKNTPFSVDLRRPEIPAKEVSSRLRQLLPASVDTLYDAAGVRAAVLYCFRNSVGDQHDLDALFAAVKYLNSRSSELKIACNSREYRSTSDVLRHATIRVGQVVQHKENGHRGVCIGWTTYDEGNKKQKINILFDWFDPEELLDGDFPSTASFDASEFRVIESGPQTRICNQLISSYFCRYEPFLGVYIPNKKLQFQYPFDTTYLLKSSEKFYKAAEVTGNSWDGICGAADGVRRNVYACNPCDVSTTTSSTHMAVVDNLLLRHHNWKGNRQYWINQEEISRSSEHVISILKQYYDRLSHVFEPFLTNRSPHSTVFTLVNDLMRNLEESLNQENQFNVSELPPENASDIERLLSVLNRFQKSSPSRYWDDNSVLPLSSQQKLQHVALNSLESFYKLFFAVEQMLVLRYQNIRGRVSEFEHLLPSTNHQEDFPLPPLDNTTVKFRIGQILYHKKFKYRGVCAGWDVRPITDASTWEGVADLALGQEQPFYRIVPDEGDVWKYIGPGEFRDCFYVAQENLESVEALTHEREQKYVDISDSAESDNSQAFKDIQTDRMLNKIRRRDLITIKNPELAEHFVQEDSRNGLYRAKENLRFCFSLLKNQDDDSLSSPPLTEYEDCEKALLEGFSLLKKCFISFSSSATDEDSIQCLLFNASCREDAEVFSKVMWLRSTLTESTHCSIMMREAIALMSRGNSDQALDLFEKICQSHPNYGVAHSYAGILQHSTRNDHHKCIEYSNTALECDPKLSTAHSAIAFALEALSDKQDSEAIERMEKSLELDPWAGHVVSRYTKLLWTKNNFAPKKRKKGSLSVVHLQSDEEEPED